jgi:hypothetical protein
MLSWPRRSPSRSPVIPRSACGRYSCLVNSGKAFPKASGGRPILLAHDSGRSEPFQTCFATSEAKQVVLPSVQIDPADMSLATSVSVTALSAIPGEAA